MDKNDIKKYFPFDTYRDNQKETLEKIVELFENNRIVILRSPVGSGKSPIGITMGKMFNSSYYITPQKILQDQLGNDFTDKDFTIVKGRGNFGCKFNGNSCEYGVCVLEKIKVKGGEDYPESYCNNDPKGTQCLYKLQRDKGAITKICNMNFAYFLIANKEIFGKRDLLIIDEAHSIASWALNFISTTINSKDLQKMPKIPDYTEFADYIKWLNDTILPIIGERLNLFGNVLNEEDKKLEQNLEYLLDKIKNLIDDYFINKEEWVWEINRENPESIKFQPVTVGRFMNNLIWKRTDKILLMSGTILAPDMFLKEIGLENEKYEQIIVPSNFHYQYNPVLYYPVGKMTKDCKYETLPKIVEKLKEIIINHGDEKGIIHCGTYDIAKYVYENIGELRHKIILQKQKSRNQSLNEFIKSKDKILLSINMTEGIDLKDDLSRFQVLLKIPYPFLGDKRIYKRVMEYGEEDWYNLQAVETICQSYGRAQRNEDDWAKFYILDESFTNLWNRYYNYFTQEFINSYRYGIELKKVLESSYILPKNT